MYNINDAVKLVRDLALIAASVWAVIRFRKERNV
jgi:hypothetical protein